MHRATHNYNFTYMYQCNWFSSQSSIKSAIKLLNLSQKNRYSPKEIRDAYFTAAKLCHPDSTSATIDEDEHDVDEEKRKEYLTNRFHEITEAYELLQKYPDLEVTGEGSNSCNDSIEFTTQSEEDHFRDACKEFLGVDAEIVEESKRCPLFREWLKGRTVDAFLWNLFLMKHGGLAPMLMNRKNKTLTSGIAQGHDHLKTRRRRKD